MFDVKKGSYDTCKYMTRFDGFEGFYEADGLLDVMIFESKKAEWQGMVSLSIMKCHNQRAMFYPVKSFCRALIHLYLL